MTHNHPAHEQYRLIGLQWADADAAARMLEESKPAFLAQLITKQGDIAYNRAETAVKASAEWSDYIRRMVDAKQKANRLRVELEYFRMEFMRQAGENANRRAEMRL